MTKPTHVNITGPADLIASIPALIGFTPTDSILIVGLADGALLFSMRVDIDAAAPTVAAGQVGATITGNGATNVIILAVSPHQQKAETVAHVVAAMLAADGIPIARQLHTPQITPGSPWHCIETGQHGTLADPQATVYAAEKVYAGGSTRSTRHEIEHELDPIGTPIATEPADTLHTDPFAAIATLARLAAEHAAGTPLADSDAATIGALLVDTPNRDAALGLLVSDDRDAIGALCAAAARRLAGPARSAAATIYAAARYIAGDGTRAGIAIDAALTADPDNRLAALIDLSLTHGAPPALIRAAARAAANDQ